jgi:hypothetical protein
MSAKQPNGEAERNLPVTIQHTYSYPATLQDSLKVNWRVEDLIGDDKSLDFSLPFLPEALARTWQTPHLAPSDRLTLNHIRGATYLHLFGLVEEFILPFAIERAQEGVHGNKARIRALLTFAEEEAKHQVLFQRFGEEFRKGFRTELEVIGPAQAIAETVLSHSRLAVAILILHLEWLTQRHYLESVKTDESLEPRFVSLLKHHWQEEAQHAKIDTLVLAEISSLASPQEIDKAIDEFLAIGGILDEGLQAQVKFDIKALERASGRTFTESEKQDIEQVQLASYRHTFLVSGLQQENFLRAVRDLSVSGAERVQAAARALS